MDDDKADVEFGRQLGASWVVSGDLFIQVELNDLGLIHATGIWTNLDLPTESTAITDVFQELLSNLDEL